MLQKPYDIIHCLVRSSYYSIWTENYFYLLRKLGKMLVYTVWIGIPFIFFLLRKVEIEMHDETVVCSIMW